MKSRALGASFAALALFTWSSTTSALATRGATFSWDKLGVLHGSFDFRDALSDKKIVKRIQNGLAVNLVMRGYVYQNGSTTPVALTALHCNFAYDLWDAVYKVSVNSAKPKVVVNMKGVYRLCTDMVDLPITDRATLGKRPQDYYLAVKVEVNPVSAKLLQDIQRWVTRPLGVSGSLSPGDALFATFVSVFITKQVASADVVIDFQTANFPP